MRRARRDDLIFSHLAPLSRPQLNHGGFACDRIHDAERLPAGAMEAFEASVQCAFPSRIGGSNYRSFRTTATHVMSSDWGAPFANSATRSMTCSTTPRAGWPRISRIACSRRSMPN
jgi:hypothetical protein